MRLLFNGAIAGNGFNSLGHYVRDEPLVSSCTNYATTPVPGCSSNFAARQRDERVGGERPPDGQGAPPRPTAWSPRRSSRPVEQSRSGASMQGLLAFLMGSGQ